MEPKKRFILNGHTDFQNVTEKSNKPLYFKTGNILKSHLYEYVTQTSSEYE